MSFLSSLLKGAIDVGGAALAPETGGLSLIGAGLLSNVVGSATDSSSPSVSSMS